MYRKFSKHWVYTSKHDRYFFCPCGEYKQVKQGRQMVKSDTTLIDGKF